MYIGRNLLCSESFSTPGSPPGYPFLRQYNISWYNLDLEAVGEEPLIRHALNYAKQTA